MSADIYTVTAWGPAGSETEIATFEIVIDARGKAYDAVAAGGTAEIRKNLKAFEHHSNGLVLRPC